MSAPRQILPEQTYLITRTCTQRQYLMRPDEETNNAFIYCLAIAAMKYAIDIIYMLAESNHHHTVVFDRHGNISRFIEYFHRLFARSQNRLRGRWENFWAAQEPCVTRLLDRSTIIDKVVYTATNPVKDRLVERARHWPGANAYSAFFSGRAIQAYRPRHFFRTNGPLPETVTLQLVVPAELGPASQFIDDVRVGIEAVESAILEERRSTGAQIVGRRAIRKQSWRAQPTTVKPRRVLRPRFAGPSHLRVPALLAYSAFRRAYRSARELLKSGHAALFPPGTYWLARFAGVAVAPITTDSGCCFAPACN